jgi:transmembrane sensor
MLRKLMDKKALLIKYYNGESNRKEIEYLLEHIGPEDTDNYHSVMKQLWDSFLLYPDLEASVAERIYSKILEAGNIQESNPSKYGIGYGMRVAATLTGLILVSALVIWMMNQMNEIIYSTSYGEKKTIILSDSSEITLNSNSTLRLSSNYNSRNREVFLTGEAYFDIKEITTGSKKQLFIVHANDVLVEVIGTKFNVSTRRNKTLVVLESGKVQLNLNKNETDSHIMQPGEFVAYTSESKNLERKFVDPEIYSSWRNNILVFEEATIQQIAQTIEDHFGYAVILDDEELMRKMYKGTFPTDNVEVLLESLSKSFDLQVIMHGKNIIMKN